MKPGALRYVFSEKIRNTKSVAEMNNWIGPNLAEIQDKNMFHCSTQELIIKRVPLSFKPLKTLLRTIKF